MFSRSDYFTESKLALLYLLHKSGINLTIDQIADCMTGNDLMNYFDISQGLADLTDAGLIYAHSTDALTTAFSCSNAGKISLGEFKVMIPASVRETLDNYISENLLKLRRENENFTDCIHMPDGTYVARLRSRDDDITFDIALTLPDRETAEKVCKKWPERSGDVYSHIIQSLLD